MKSNRRNFLLMAVCAVSLSACGSGGDSSSNSGKTVKPTAADGAIEKPSLKLGFIKLTDMAPLAIAKEKGFFAEEGLNVTLEPQANWKVLLDGVIGGQLDGAHMLAGQPLAATIGYGTKADLIAPLSLDLNGNAITLSNKVWAQIGLHAQLRTALLAGGWRYRARLLYTGRRCRYSWCRGSLVCDTPAADARHHGSRYD